jgi:hypothetical protein
MSVHAGTAQTCVAAGQMPLWQSPATWQARPLAHLGQPEVAPPQLTSVSAPFFTVSVHDGAAQVPFVQTALVQSVAATHILPSAHLGQPEVAPPQLTSVSVPFFTVSVQEGTAQRPLVQTPLRQSAAAVHIFVSAHLAQVPPQSTSVSLPFLVMSPHIATWQTPAMQTPSTQLVPLVPHPLPFPHFIGQVPPQSTSVSLPFLIVSVHSGAAHAFVLAGQTPLAQSPPVAHPLPSAHRLPGAQVPPQSTSVSLPFLSASPHDGAAHTFVPAGQTRLLQSPATAQTLPSAHSGQLAPPQSMSVSVPFLMPSVQLAARHEPPIHTPLSQSPAAVQLRPAAQRGQPEVAPPQSRSVSLPFFTKSAQSAVVHDVAMQTKLAQSPPPAHFLPGAQAGHEPPQFTSDSEPFLTASMQDGAAQVPPMHTPLWQSPVAAQTLPSRHLPQAVPPQSTSVSVPFLTMSAHPAL